MKNSILSIAAFALSLVSFGLSAQTSRPIVAVADIDVNDTYANGANYSIEDFVMIEMSKIEGIELLDRYDMDFLAKRDQIEINGCFSKICLKEIGRALNVDKVLTGSLLTIGDNIVVNFRLLDVVTGSIEKNHTVEFLKLSAEVKNMIGITIQEMFDLPVDEELKKKLSVRNDYEGSVNNPYKLRLRSDGPRMGFTVFQGELADRLSESKVDGGFEAHPMMFQFGYQFEKQYLNEGNFQALFEFIPMITGLDQGFVIPSITIMNGLRNNKNGWEFAFGPTFSVVPMSKGYYDQETDQWTLTAGLDSIPVGVSEIRRMDSRGEMKIQPGFVFAAGKTFKSGKLNIPVNMYVIPNNKGLRFGLSMGFNARDRYAYSH
ncbi:MAG: hypothetical protein NWR73_03810 [Flavobacteriales bacterium]|nr:hypothetical protein [Flavobacteriales bacterium]